MYFPRRSTPMNFLPSSRLTELLAVVVAPHGAHAVDLDGLHALADDLALEVAANDLDLR